MPVLGWILLVAGLSALAILVLGLVIRSTHKLPAEEPLDGDPEYVTAPVPHDVMR